jgi:4-amino-4-deoxy-L-arabinose transferase-like glycosyltransferase
MDNGNAAGRDWRDCTATFAPALAILLLHLSFLRGYGVFRDELYYIACGRRPAWGYVDHPPLVAWVAWLVAHAGFSSHLALRVVAAVVMAATVWLAGRIAHAMGGGRYAQVLGGLATGLVPVSLSLASVYSMNVFDLFFWALLSWILVRVLSGGPERLWLAFGAVAGFGLLNKISVLYLGAGLAGGLVLSRRWDVLRSRHLWAGGALAFLIFLPHLAWQHAHGWPTLEFMANARREKMAPLSPLGFVLGAVDETLPVVWLWALGVAFLLLAPRAARLRPLAITFLAVLGILAFAGGKPYYLAAAYAPAFAAGAVALEGWTETRGRLLRPLAALLVVVLGLVAAPLARPMLATDDYVRYAAALGQKPGTEERHALGRLPQFYADMHGWRELAEAVAGVVHALPAGERAEACVFGQNYGEAGAVEYFARELDLPPAISAHNSYWLWGPGRCAGSVIVVIGGRGRERLAELFGDVRQAGVSRCRDCMPYEDALAIWVVRQPKLSLAELWPRIRRFI